MNEEQFWRIIDSSKNQANGDPDVHIEELTLALTDLPESEIIAFEHIFTELSYKAYSWPLWGAAYIIGGGCSDDGFMDFRGWLISKGQKVYEEALRNPESLLEVMNDKDSDGQIEGFHYAPADAWAKKTGKNYEDFPYTNFNKYPDEPSGKQWEDNELLTLFPKLWEKFGE